MIDLSVFTPKMHVLSNIFAARTLDNDPADLFQEMALTLIEKSIKNPEFQNQTESYIVHAARLRAITLADDNKVFSTYNQFVNDDPEAEYGWFDQFASDDLSPEDAVIRKQDLAEIAAAMRDLSDREAEVMSMVVEGVRTKDIAAKLGVAPATVSTLKDRAVSKIKLALEH